MKLSTEALAKAKAMYLTGKHSTEEIAQATSLNASTLLWRISHEKWPEERKMIQRKAMENASSEVLELVHSNKLDTLRRHMEGSRLLEMRIIDRLSEMNAHGKPAYISPRDLSILAKALKDASDVSGRAVGMDKDNSAGMHVMPLVIVGMQPRRLGGAELAQMQPVIEVPEAAIANDDDPF